MKECLRGISPRAEFVLVILIAFGYLTLGSVLTVLHPISDAPAPISERSLQFLLVYESLVLIVLGAFLSVRGWHLQQLGFTPTLKDTGIGIGLSFVAYFAYVAVWLTFSSIIPGLGGVKNNLVASNLEVLTILAIAILNPIFEEVFVCGYVITTLKNTRSTSFAINVSVGLRLVYHLYQGTAGIISIIPMGLVFAYWFSTTGRLWPVVIAHAIFDLVGLLFYTRL